METNVLADFCDGTYYKNHGLFSVHRNALQIMMYYDDVEVCNPLGSHTKVHKPGKYLCSCRYSYVHVFTVPVFHRLILFSSWELPSQVSLQTQGCSTCCYMQTSLYQTVFLGCYSSSLPSGFEEICTLLFIYMYICLQFKLAPLV